MDQDLLDGGPWVGSVVLGNGTGQGRRLYELGSGADDGGYLHCFLAGLTGFSGFFVCIFIFWTKMKIPNRFAKTTISC